MMLSMSITVYMAIREDELSRLQYVNKIHNHRKKYIRWAAVVGKAGVADMRFVWKRYGAF